MKVIKQGKPWWVGKNVTCDECGCEMELELKDRPSLTQLGFDVAEIWCEGVLCPSCNKIVAVPGSPKWAEAQKATGAA